MFVALNNIQLQNFYKVNECNEFGAPTLCDFGNDLATAYTYNPYGLLTQIKTGHKCTVISEEGEILPELSDVGGAELPFEVGNPILHYQYTYNGKGLMTSRTESIINHKETYTYDNLDRLIGMTSGNMGQPGTPQTFSYHDNGNMSTHSKVGNYIYHNTKPHAVAVINQTGNAISENKCAVTYNFFIINKQEYKPSVTKKTDRNRIRFEIEETFIGNQFLSFRGILLWPFICFLAFMFFASIGRYPWGILIFPVIFGIAFFILLSWQIHYFGLTENSLIVRNHNYIWMAKIYPLSDIKEVVFEGLGNQAFSMRIITKDFRNKRYQAGTLRDKTWLSLKDKLEAKR